MTSADSDEARRVGEQLTTFAAQFTVAWADRGFAPAEIVEFAARVIPNTVGAGLTLIRDGRPPTTLAASSELAAQVDAIEYECGEGPCLDAIENDDITRADDLARDTRWPKFSERAVRETPIRSMFGVRIFLGDGNRGALNFYSPRTYAFTELDLGMGAIFSTLSSLALANAIERQKSTNLELALESSRQIGMAMGVLMSSRLLTADQAFDQLRITSQQLHRKVRDVAAEVADTGLLPEAPKGPGAGS